MSNGGFARRPDRPKPPARYAWLALPTIALALGVGSYFLWNMLFGVSISGSVSAAGSEVGNWGFTPDICESGARRSFYGVRMFSSHNSRLALLYVEDVVKGRMIEVAVPGKDYGYRFFERDCKTLNASLQDGPLINEVRAIGGTIDFICETDGGSLKGNLKFENCS